MPREHQPTVHGTTLARPDGPPIELDTPAWDAWLAQALLFYVDHPEGAYTAVSEKRQRGQRYWLARRVDRGRRVSVYLGKTIRADDLARAGVELAERLLDAPAPAPKPPIGRRVLSERQLDDLRGSLPPTVLQQSLREMLDETRDPRRRSALEALSRLVAALWPPNELDELTGDACSGPPEQSHESKQVPDVHADQ